MTKIKSDSRVYTRPSPAKEKSVAKEATPKAASSRKKPGVKRKA